jgi:SMODS-associated and fused to various effectors sensor domain
VPQFIEQFLATFRAVVYAEPEAGVGEGAIASNADAIALANHAKILISQGRSRYGAQRVHLLVAAPAAFCLFLGQRLNAVGEILTYEYNDRGVYQPSIALEG